MLSVQGLAEFSELVKLLRQRGFATHYIQLEIGVFKYDQRLTSLDDGALFHQPFRDLATRDSVKINSRARYDISGQRDKVVKNTARNRCNVESFRLHRDRRRETKANIGVCTH